MQNPKIQRTCARIEVYKFGGTSLRDSEGILKVIEIIKNFFANPNLDHSQLPTLLIVVSAMGKTTNRLEEIAQLSIDQKIESARERIISLMDYHRKNLFGCLPRGLDYSDQIVPEISQFQEQLFSIAKGLFLLGEVPPRIFDRIMSYGERISSSIMQKVLTLHGIPVQHISATEHVITDSSHKKAEILWMETKERITKSFNFFKQDSNKISLYLTEGYIASTSDGEITTLGREGSDFTAAIFSSILNAERMTVWKDVVGVLSADPKVNPNAKWIPKLSYEMAAIATFYGATILHPNTVRPLKEKNIPLWVRSYLTPEHCGTEISEVKNNKNEYSFFPEMFLIKSNLSYISIKIKNFDFVKSSDLSEITNFASQVGLSIYSSQISPFGLIIIVDHLPEEIEKFSYLISERFDLCQKFEVELVTILNPEKDNKYEPAAQKTIFWHFQDADKIQFVQKK